MNLRQFLPVMKAARDVVMEDIKGVRGDGNKYAAGLSTEGWHGGYLAALDDVEAMLRHGCPNDSRYIWSRALKNLKAKVAK